GARALRNLTGGRHYWEWRGVPFLRERADDQSFDPSFLDAPPDCVLFGYFQTPRYFESMEQEFRDELKSLLGISKQDRETGWENLGQDVPATSVAVHVRRTDYLVHPAFRVCGMNYYKNAFDTMRASVPGARFFVFSDDPAWCRENLEGQDTTIMDSGNDGIPMHDLRLMSRASHHIICNSSYSWWAAWLGKKPGQQVIMPDRWYAKDITAPIEEKRCEGWNMVGTTPAGRTR
ncbi:MAG: alpha-1,2-fucosyltransferase, partial [Verrucomicrobiae bacterium]|nr:alpha-1,2-fucosyltransferase [Verrucomicrobiae bacterium]